MIVSSDKTFTVTIDERGSYGRSYTETVTACSDLFAPDEAVQKIYARISEGRRIRFQREAAWESGPGGVTKTRGEILRSGLTGGIDILRTVDVTIVEH